MLPPSERETYQTHIPWRSKAELLTLPPLSTSPAPPVAAEAWLASAAARTMRVKGSARRMRFFCRRRITTGPNTVVMKWVRLPVSSSRKILCAAALAASVLLLAPAGASARRQRLEHADLFQAGRELVFSVRTAKP